MSIETVVGVSRARRFSFEGQKEINIQTDATGYAVNRNLAEYSSWLPYLEGQSFRNHLESKGTKGPFRLLDLGCGQGTFLLDVKGRYPQAETVGISAKDYRDLNDPEDMDALSGIDYRIGDVQRAKKEVDGMEFDFITSVWCFKYVADPLNTLRQAYSMLKPDGKMFIQGTGIFVNEAQARHAELFWRDQGIKAHLPNDPRSMGSRGLAIRKTRDIKLPMPFTYSAIPDPSSSGHRVVLSCQKVL